MSAQQTETGNAAAAFARYASRCPHRIEPSVERRPANALNVEIGTPLPRCKLKEPKAWPQKGMAARWLLSGGSPLVFGPCSRNCAIEMQFCDICGHSVESHIAGRCWPSRACGA